MLLAHSNTVHQIEMREGYDDELIKVLDEGEPVIELTNVDLVAHSSHSWS